MKQFNKDEIADIQTDILGRISNKTKESLESLGYDNDAQSRWIVQKGIAYKLLVLSAMDLASGSDGTEGDYMAIASEFIDDLEDLSDKIVQRITQRMIERN